MNDENSPLAFDENKDLTDETIPTEEINDNSTDGLIDISSLSQSNFSDVDSVLSPSDVLDPWYYSPDNVANTGYFREIGATQESSSSPVPLSPGPTTLTVEILSWDTVVIDHNKPHLGEGMNDTTIEIKICNTGLNDATNVTTNFTWNSTVNSSYIYLHPNERAVKNIGTILAGQCKLVFYEVSMIRDKNQQGRTRAFTVNVTSDETNPVNASQTLLLEIAQEQNQDSSVVHETTGSLYPICENFTISYWMNITREVTHAGFPVVYDPGVIELVNVSVIVILPGGNVTLEGIFIDDNQTLARASHLVYYTFHAVGDGNTSILPVIADYKTNYHYNFEEDAAFNVTVCTVPPTINKTIGNPNCTIIPDAEYCVTTNTPILINASGYCCNLTEVMYNNGSGWINITNQLPFTHYFSDECTHWLNITAKDCLGNFAYDNQTFYVDDTPPDVTKTVGDPNCDLGGGDYCVNLSTEINLTVTNGGCCPSAAVSLMYRIWNGTWSPWQMYTGNFSFTEECVHYLEINASDCLGNQFFDNETFYVDETTLEIVKTVGDPSSGGPIEWYVTTDTNITINATNAGCCPGTTVLYRIWNGTAWNPNWTDISDILPFNISFDEECEHWLNITAYDCYGNQVWDNETFYVNHTASLGDYVWEDLDGDGIQDTGEPGIPSVTVNLYYSNGTLAATTTTNATGYYLFTGLVPSDYFVGFVLPSGYIFSPLNNTGNDALDSDANVSTGNTSVTTLSQGEVDLSWDAGMYQPASLGDYVWEDLDGDGVQDSTEIGIANVIVELYYSNGTLARTTTTNATGHYIFTNLIPGNYYVEFISPSGYRFTPQDQGDDYEDSDANTTTGATIVTTLDPGENDMSWDAGIQPLLYISKEIWNGTQWVDLHRVNASVTVRFNISVHNNGFDNLIAINVTDFLPSCLSYANNATVNGSPQEPSVWNSNLTWSFTGPLAPCSWLYIEFNATVLCTANDTNTIINPANATAVVESTGTILSNEDDAIIKIGGPPWSWLVVTLDPGGYASPASTFCIKADDDSGIWKIWYRMGPVLREGDWNEYVYFKWYIEGWHTIEYWAEDGEGLEETPHHIEKYYIDSKGPDVSLAFDGIVEVSALGVYQTTQKTLIRLNAVDEGIGIKNIFYKIDNGTWHTYKDPFGIANKGKYNVYYYATDLFGNMGLVRRQVIQVGDGEPKTTCYVTPGEPTGSNGWHVSPVTITLAATDEVSGVNCTLYRIDNGTWQTYTGPFVIDEDGIHIIQYYSVDNVGNKEDINGEKIRIDLCGPEITISRPVSYIYIFNRAIMPLPGDKPFILGKITIVALVEDIATSGVDHAQLYVDDELKATFVDEEMEYTLDETLLGTHTLKIIAYDVAGNKADKIMKVAIYNINIEN